MTNTPPVARRGAELLPCPFCGGEAREPIDYAGFTGCHDRACAGNKVVTLPAAWNRRVLERGMWSLADVGVTPRVPAPHPDPVPPVVGCETWAIGSWLSAALDDPNVCEAMKADIREWFDANGHVRGGES